MNSDLIHWSDESQLLGYGESDSTGAWLKFRVTPEDLEHFRGLKGVVFYLTTVQMADDGSPVANDHEPVKTAEPAHVFGKEASELYRNGFFLVPDVLLAIGPDDAFLEWLKKQPCAIAASRLSREASYSSCGGDVVPAHVRRIANGAGTGLKPPYSAIPLCDTHHKEQHQRGESGVMAHGTGHMQAKEWFDKQRNRYVQSWASHRLAAFWRSESIGDVNPMLVRGWAQEERIDQWLPGIYGRR